MSRCLEEMMQITLQQFYLDIDAHARTRKWRYGQAAFNYLQNIRPDLADAVRGSNMDPFYVQQFPDDRWERFVAYLESNW